MGCVPLKLQTIVYKKTGTSSRINSRFYQRLEKQMEITLKQFSETLKRFQEIHPECPYLHARFSAGSNKVGLYYSGGCYINDYQHTFEEVYSMMISDVSKAS
jgi:meiotically up-regulated gene 157 (Mug157) protein